jgi:kynurenine formamidase
VRPLPNRRAKTKTPYAIEKDGFRATYYESADQYGTHIDPPAHFAKDGITMDKIPLAEMILPLVVFDATRYLAADPNHAFSVKDLNAWEAQNGRVPSGAFAALRTDMSSASIDRVPAKIVGIDVGISGFPFNLSSWYLA